MKRLLLWLFFVVAACGAPVEETVRADQAFTLTQWSSYAAPQHLYQVTKGTDGTGLCGIDPYGGDNGWGNLLVCQSAGGAWTSFGGGYAVDFYDGYKNIYAGETSHAGAITSDGTVWQSTTAGWTPWSTPAYALPYPGSIATWSSWYVIGGDHQIWTATLTTEYFRYLETLPSVDGAAQYALRVVAGSDDLPVVVTENCHILWHSTSGWQMLFHGQSNLCALSVSVGAGARYFNDDDASLNGGGVWMIAAQSADQTGPLGLYQHVYHASTGHRWFLRTLPSGVVSPYQVLVSSPQFPVGTPKRVWTQSMDPNNTTGPRPMWMGQ